jgi:glyoxylase-like metal-dependent hydrolase (beta-lactamase superfamily II)
MAFDHGLWHPIMRMWLKSRIALAAAVCLLFFARPLGALEGVMIQPKNCGFFLTDRKYMVAGAASEKVRIPIPFYVIRHPKGVVLFDTGLGTEFTAQLQGWWLHRFFQWTLPYEFDPANAAVAQVRAMDIDPKDVAFIVVSHLHYDHAGGLRDFPKATVVVSRAEWEKSDVSRWLARFRGVMSETLEGLKSRLLLLDFSGDSSFDLFNDGALVVLFTPGHTSGHQSLLVTTGSGRKVLLTGDAVWLRENYQKPAPKSWIIRHLEEYDADQAWTSTLFIRDFAEKNPDALVVPGHDPDLWEELPAEIR